MQFQMPNQPKKHNDYPVSNGNGANQTESRGERREGEKAVNYVDIVPVGGNDTQHYDGDTLRGLLKMTKEGGYSDRKNTEEINEVTLWRRRYARQEKVRYHENCRSVDKEVYSDQGKLQRVH